MRACAQICGHSRHADGPEVPPICIASVSQRNHISPIHENPKSAVHVKVRMLHSCQICEEQHTLAFGHREGCSHGPQRQRSPDLGRARIFNRREAHGCRNTTVWSTQRAEPHIALSTTRVTRDSDRSTRSLVLQLCRMRAGAKPACNAMEATTLESSARGVCCI